MSKHLFPKFRNYAYVTHVREVAFDVFKNPLVKELFPKTKNYMSYFCIWALHLNLLLQRYVVPW